MSPLHEKLAAIEAVFTNWINLGNAEDALKAAYNDLHQAIADEVTKLEAKGAALDGAITALAERVAADANDFGSRLADIEQVLVRLVEATPPASVAPSAQPGDAAPSSSAP